jgi:hypothetical protein
MIYTAFSFISISLFMIENRGRSPREAIIRQQGNQPDQSPHGGGSKSPECQPLPNVWDVLERKVKFHAPDAEDPPRGEEYYREIREVNRSLNELDEKGTDRDRLTEELYNTITIEPRASLPVPFKVITLSLEEFQQLRSRVEPLSDDELRDEVRKAKEQKQRKRDEIHKRNRARDPRSPSLGTP